MSAFSDTERKHVMASTVNDGIHHAKTLRMRVKAADFEGIRISLFLTHCPHVESIRD